jgi:hypothetical protein
VLILKKFYEEEVDTSRKKTKKYSDESQFDHAVIVILAGSSGQVAKESFGRECEGSVRSV